MTVRLNLRPYANADEDAAIELWRRTWQHHFPQIDFNERLAWWRERWQTGACAGRRCCRRGERRRVGRLCDDRPEDALSRSDRGRAGALGLARIATALLDEAKRLRPRASS